MFLVLATLSFAEFVFSANPQELLKGYEDQAAKASPTRGEQFFNTKHGKEWSCASCHENPPNHSTKHIVTGKVIKPLTPNNNPERFVDQARLINGLNATAMMCLRANVLRKKKQMCSLGY